MPNENFNNISKQDVEKAKNAGAQKLFASLSDKDKKTVTDLLADENKLREVLKSPMAAALFKMFKNGDKNG